MSPHAFDTRCAPSLAASRTASAGNMAQGVAWAARELGVPCTVIAPDHAPAARMTKATANARSRGQVA